MTGPENTYANALALSADAQWAVAAGQFSRSVTFSTSARLCVFLVSPCPFLFSAPIRCAEHFKHLKRLRWKRYRMSRAAVLETIVSRV
jgi:hypothetical protein